MSWLRSLKLRLRALLHRDEAERALEDEFAFHIEQETAANVRLGMSPETARRAALLAFGGVERHKEDYRDGRGFRWLEETAADLRQALRSFRRSPRVIAAVCLTLGLGLGLAGSVFAVMDEVLFRLPSVRAPGELVMLRGEHAGRPESDGVSWPDFWDLRAALDPIESMAVFEDAFDAPVVLADGSPALLGEGSVGYNFLDVLGVAPALGRGFVLEEHRDRLPVVMVSHDLWRGRLGGDSTVLAQSIELGGQRRRIVGVLPPGIGYPSGVDFVVPARESQPAPEENQAKQGFGRSWRQYRVIARVRPGQDVGAALETQSALLERTHPETNTGYRVLPAPFRAPGTDSLRQPIVLLQIGVLLILAIAVVNVASLLLARSIRERHQTAIRLAMGAGVARVIRAGVLESLLFAGLGGGLGLGLAVAVVEVARRITPVPLPPGVEVDWRVMAATALVATIAAVAAGIVPTLLAARQDLDRSIRIGGRGVGGSGGGSSRGVARAQSGMLAAQVALSTLLLLASGMFLVGYGRVSRVDPGFNHASDVLSVRISLQRPKYQPWDGFLSFFQTVDREVAALPGVVASGLSFNNPMEPGRGFMVGFEIPGVVDVATDSERPTAALWPVSSGFFRTVGLPLIRGRTFDRSDGRDGSGVVIVNQAFAERYLPGRDPLGLMLEKTHFWGDTFPAEHRIIGIVADLRADGYAEDPYPTMFFPFEQAPFGNMRVLVRSRAEPAALAAALREAIWRLDPAIPLDRLERLDVATAATLRPERFAAALTALLGLAAMLLTGIGLFGALSYAVGARIRELGIRLALGASPVRLLREVAARAGAIVLVGWAFGLSAFLAIGGLITRSVFETRMTDPLVLGAGSIVLAIAAGLAAVGPARKAAGVAPAEVLRSE